MSMICLHKQAYVDDHGRLLYCPDCGECRTPDGDRQDSHDVDETWLGDMGMLPWEPEWER